MFLPQKVIGLLTLLKRKSSKKQHKAYLLAIIFCFSLSSLFLYNKDNQNFLNTYEHILHDFVLYFASPEKVELLNNEEYIRPSLVVLDDKTYVNWQRPGQLPREQLISLINQTKHFNDQPTYNDIRFMAFDIDLAANNKGVVSKESNDIVDKNLTELLLKSEKLNLPLLFVTRSFSFKERDENELRIWDVGTYDFAIAQSSNVFWSTTQYRVSTDGVRRAWSLSELVCKNERLEWLPSMQLLLSSATFMENSHTNKEISKHLIDQIKNINLNTNDVSCSEAKNKKITSYSEYCNAYKAKCENNFYLSPNNTFPVNLTQNLQRFYYRSLPPKTGELSLLKHHSIGDITESGWESGQVPPSTSVIVGTDYSDSYDKHAIPFRSDDISGVYLIINSWLTMIQYGQLTEAPIGVQIFILFVASFLVYFLLRNLTIGNVLFLGSVVLTVLLFLILFGTSRYGVLIDVGIPLICTSLIMAITEVTLAMREHREERGK